MDEYKFQLVIAPESYDYGEEEIVYRIYLEDQLISERSLPILENNQGIVDTFFLKLKKDTSPIFLKFKNIKNKKALLKNISINDIKFPENTTNAKVLSCNIKIYLE